MIHIVGEHVAPEMQAFKPVKDCLVKDWDVDLYLGSFMANPLGLDITKKVCYNMEYLHKDNPLFKAGYLETLRKNVVVDFARSNIEYLKSQGIDVFYMPFGFCKSMKKIKDTCEKPIDVLFIGSMHFPRRQEVIKKLSKYCKVFVPNKTYGKELDSLISKAKVHLNMHHAEGQPLETVRVNYLLANNCTVVSELGNDKELNSKYFNNVVFSSYKNLVDACLSSLNKTIDSSNLFKELRHNSKDACKWAKEKKCQL